MFFIFDFLSIRLQYTVRKEYDLQQPIIIHQNGYSRWDRVDVYEREGEIFVTSNHDVLYKKFLWIKKNKKTKKRLPSRPEFVRKFL